MRESSSSHRIPSSNSSNRKRGRYSMSYKASSRKESGKGSGKGSSYSEVILESVEEQEKYSIGLN